MYQIFPTNECKRNDKFFLNIGETSNKITDLNDNHQWLLKPLDEKLMDRIYNGWIRLAASGPTDQF